jgi:phospho-2-dehydro-3-deoxyheptonate aldolase
VEARSIASWSLTVVPVGIKNRTDGDIAVAIDAIRAAAHRWFRR